MAEIVFSAVRPSSTVQYITWAGLTTNDTGRPYEVAGLPDKTVQIFGNFGSNASVALEGSNDPRVLEDVAAGTTTAAWFPLTDAQGNAITKTAAAGEVIQENPRFIRPAVTLGTSPSITVIITAGGR